MVKTFSYFFANVLVVGILSTTIPNCTEKLHPTFNHQPQGQHLQKYLLLTRLGLFFQKLSDHSLQLPKVEHFDKIEYDVFRFGLTFTKKVLNTFKVLFSKPCTVERPNFERF